MSEKKELKTFDKISTSELKKIGVQALPNRPNEGSVYGNAGLSPKELKEWFDKMALRLANHINSVTNVFGTEEIAQYIRISLDEHNIDTLQGFIDSVLDGSFAENLLMVLPTATDTERAPLQDVVFSINRKMSTEIDRVEKLITDLGYGYTDADVVFVEDGGEVGADVVAEDDNGARRLIFTFRNFGKGVAEAALGFPLKEGTGENTLVQTTDSDNGNKAITENSIALGEGSIAGAKGYYIREIFYGNTSTNPQIRITTEQPKDTGLYISSSALTPNPSFTKPNYANGDVFNLICNDHFALFGTITSITNDVITFTGDTAFFKASLNLQISYGHSKMSGNYYINLVPDYDDYTLCVPRKPLNGIVEVCKTAFSSGCENVSAGAYGEATGKRNIVVGAYGHAEGSSNLAGYSAHAEGQDCEAPAKYSHAQNKETKATGYASTAMGKKTVASGECSTATNIECAAEGEGATAEGCRTKAKMKYSHTEGMDTETNTDTIPLADSAHAEGRGTKATNYGSHAEGGWAVASGEYSHAQNYQTIASGTRATAMGHNTIASGSRAVAEGDATEASGYCSHSAGLGTKAKNASQYVVGQYNKDNSNALFVVGNGTSDTNRSNALEVLKDGSINMPSDPLLKVETGTVTEVITSVDSLEGSYDDDWSHSIQIPLNIMPVAVYFIEPDRDTIAFCHTVATEVREGNIPCFSNKMYYFRHTDYSQPSYGLTTPKTFNYIVFGYEREAIKTKLTLVDMDGGVIGVYDVAEYGGTLKLKRELYQHNNIYTILLGNKVIFTVSYQAASFEPYQYGLTRTKGGAIEFSFSNEESSINVGAGGTFYIVSSKK
jgi:hypothetical protein